MIGLVLVTHGGLAASFRSALEHIVGPQEQFRTISIAPDDVAEARRTEISEAVDEVDSGSGVIVLTDMFGGTPSNLAISVLEAGRVEVIAGVNLPLLIKLASLRDQVDLREAVDQAQAAGRKYIHVASQDLNADDRRASGT